MKKRSKYRPKKNFADPVSWVLNGFKPMRGTDDALNLKIKNHHALLDLTQGKGGRDQIDEVISAMNMAEAMYIINPDLGKQYSTEIKAAQDALYYMARRGLDKGKFLFTGEEMQAINLGMEIHDAQLDACTLAELEKALDYVIKAITLKNARVIAEAA